MAAIANPNKNKSNNIKVLTYNISWETTKPHRKGDDYSPMKDSDIVAKCRLDVNTCRKNIAGVIRSKQPLDFIALQEVPFKVPPSDANVFDSSKLIDITDQWDEILGISPKAYHIFNHTESVASMKVYVSTKYKVFHTCGGALPGTGRPFLAIFVQSNITKEKIAFINIHAGHGGKNDSSKISGSIENGCGNWLRQTDRYIMASDFNRDVTNSNNKSIILNNKRLYNKLHPRPHTCCSNDASRRYRRPSDHILDSKGLFKNYTSGEGVYPSSDHAWVYAELDDSSLKKSPSKNSSHKVKIQTSVPKSKPIAVPKPTGIRIIRYNKNDNYYLRVSMDIKNPDNKKKIVRSTNTINKQTRLKTVCGQEITSNSKKFKLVEYNSNNIYILGYIQSRYINKNNMVNHPNNISTLLRRSLVPRRSPVPNTDWSKDYTTKPVSIPNGTFITFPCGATMGNFIAVYDVNNPNIYGYARISNISGGKKVRKHQGIIQTGGNVGRLRKGYRYSGKKLKSGLPQIIKCKSKKQKK